MIYGKGRPFFVNTKDYTKAITEWTTLAGTPSYNGNSIVLPNGAQAKSSGTFEFGSSGRIQLLFKTTAANRTSSTSVKTPLTVLLRAASNTVNANGFGYSNYYDDKNKTTTSDAVFLGNTNVYNTIKAANGTAYVLEQSAINAAFIIANVTRYTSAVTNAEPFEIYISNQIGFPWTIGDIFIKTF